MAKVRAIDMLFLDDLFEMGGGYVLKFSDRTFSEFFHQELSINIDDPLYAKNGKHADNYVRRCEGKMIR